MSQFGDLYGVTEDFLAADDSSDLRTSVNNQITSALATGSVTLARPHVGRVNRFAQALTTNVEIHRDTPAPPRVIGPGWVERDVAFLIDVTARKPDVAAGMTTQDIAHNIAHAIVMRYDGNTNCDISSGSTIGSTAFFRRASAQLAELNEDAESHEFARAVVRLVFTFTETQEAQ